MLCPHNMFLSLFAMNQRYGCLRCMKTLAIVWIKMIVSVVQSICIFFLLGRQKKSVAGIVFAPSRDFLVSKHVLKAGEIEWIEYSWIADSCDRKTEEDKTDLMLWIDFKKSSFDFFNWQKDFKSSFSKYW